MKEKNFTLEAVGEFPFNFYIEKAEATEEHVDEKSELILEGIASTTNIDHDKERMSKDALRMMESAINKEGVPLRVEHQKDGAAIIGKVFKAWVDDRNQLHIRARLDKTHPVSSILHSSMKQGSKMGLSVGGLVKRAVREFSEATGGMIKTFYDVALQEVSVTPRPANYDSWLVAKSIAKDANEAEFFRENPALQREFLLENSQLDYLQAFAKSVPDKAWHKVESPEVKKETNNNKNMPKEDEKDEKDTEKAISRSEFSAVQKGLKDLAKAVASGFNSLAKAMSTEAKVTTNPDKTMVEDETQQKAKAMDGDAKDATNPDKKKPEDDSATAKAEKDKEEMEEKEKSEKDDEEKETKKAEDDEKDEKKEKAEKEGTKDDEYDIETVNRAIKSMNAITKKMKKAEDKDEKETEKAEDDKDEKETEKAEDKDEKDEMETKKHHPMDVFVASITKAMEAMAEKMEKDGRRVLGFEKSFIDDLRTNPEVQAEIAKFMKVPGFKKSVARGVPYMVTKDGRSIPLITIPESVEKSENEGAKDFKALYKSKYSSVQESTNE